MCTCIALQFGCISYDAKELLINHFVLVYFASLLYCEKYAITYLTYVCKLNLYKQILFCIGMLSKSKGQILRLAAVLHVLFQVKEQADQSNMITDDALAAAIDFVHTSVEHTAYIAGRDIISKELEKVEEGTHSIE